jgi:hypothetical protein
VVHIVSVYLSIPIFISTKLDIKGCREYDFGSAKKKAAGFLRGLTVLKVMTSRGEQLTDAGAPASTSLNMEIYAALNKGVLFNKRSHVGKILQVKKEGHRIAPGPL